MPEPIPFRESNVTFHAPPGRPEVGDLHVLRADGYLISKWRLTKPEIEELSRNGGCVWLMVMGEVMPPVCITVAQTFITHGDAS